MDTEKPLLKDSDGDDVDVHLYKSMIGSLMLILIVDYAGADWIGSDNRRLSVPRGFTSCSWVKDQHTLCVLITHPPRAPSPFSKPPVSPTFSEENQTGIGWFPSAQIFTKTHVADEADIEGLP
ncbi:hypothetical protein Tco_0183182 [Tanacetum coccineum]